MKAKLLVLLFTIICTSSLFATDYGFDNEIWYRFAGTGSARERFENGTDEFDKIHKGRYILFGTNDTYQKVRDLCSGNWGSLTKSMFGDTVDIFLREGTSEQAMEAYLNDYIEIDFFAFEIDAEFWYAVVFIPNSAW